MGHEKKDEMKVTKKIVKPTYKYVVELTEEEALNLRNWLGAIYPPKSHRDNASVLNDKENRMNTANLVAFANNILKGFGKQFDWGLPLDAYEYK